MQFKRCSHCKVNKPITEFNKNRSCKDGLHDQCKQCRRETDRLWKKAHPDKVREIALRWYRAHPDYERNRRLRWKKANPDKVRDSQLRYSRNNSDKIRDFQRRYAQAHPDKVNAATHRHLARKRGNGGSYTAQEWRNLCERQAYLCACCGKKKKLTVDHVLPLVRGGSSDIGNIQALCQSCNSRKNIQHIDYRLEWT